MTYAHWRSVVSMGLPNRCHGRLRRVEPRTTAKQMRCAVASETSFSSWDLICWCCWLLSSSSTRTAARFSPILTSASLRFDSLRRLQRRATVCFCRGISLIACMLHFVCFCSVPLPSTAAGVATKQSKNPGLSATPRGTRACRPCSRRV